MSPRVRRAAIRMRAIITINCEHVVRCGADVCSRRRLGLRRPVVHMKMTHVGGGWLHRQRAIISRAADLGAAELPRDLRRLGERRVVARPLIVARSKSIADRIGDPLQRDMALAVELP